MDMLYWFIFNDQGKSLIINLNPDTEISFRLPIQTRPSDFSTKSIQSTQQPLDC